MKIQMLIVTAVLLASGIAASADEYVNGYYKKDGTYVQGYYRTTPDSNPYNNYSTQGNTNPYTGQPGYVDPYKAQQPSYGSSYGPTVSPSDSYNGGLNRRSGY